MHAKKSCCVLSTEYATSLLSRKFGNTIFSEYCVVGFKKPIGVGCLFADLNFIWTFSYAYEYLKSSIWLFSAFASLYIYKFDMLFWTHMSLNNYLIIKNHGIFFEFLLENRYMSLNGLNPLRPDSIGIYYFYRSYHFALINDFLT